MSWLEEAPGGFSGLEGTGWGCQFCGATEERWQPWMSTSEPLVGSRDGEAGLGRTFSLKMKARMAAESSARKMTKMNRKNCKDRGQPVRPGRAAAQPCTLPTVTYGTDLL